MHDLIQQGCFYHAARVAAARCPRCRRFFCRECVTEHEGQVICASCLARLGARVARRGAGLAALALAAPCAAGLLALWLAFYGLGHLLLRLPSTFHEGVLWKADGDQPRDLIDLP
jgi:hypothetical protein